MEEKGRSKKKGRVGYVGGEEKKGKKKEREKKCVHGWWGKKKKKRDIQTDRERRKMGNEGILGVVKKKI